MPETFDTMDVETLRAEAKRLAFLHINREGPAHDVWDEAHAEGDDWLLGLFHKLGGPDAVAAMEYGS